MKLYLLLSLLTCTIHTSKEYKSITGKPEIGLSTCTGVYVSPTDILTAGHCMANSRGHQWILTNDGKSFSAEVIKVDAYRDLALIRVKAFKHPIAKIGNNAFRTERVYTVNSGEELYHTYGAGVVMNLVTIDEDYSPMIMHSIPIMHGASGSGLFDENGRIIGINTRTRGAISLATSTNDVRTFLRLCYSN